MFKLGQKTMALFATRTSLLAITMLFGLVVAPGVSEAAGGSESPAKQRWSFAGPFGTFDRAQLQRGFKVYREVCAACHGLSGLSFRNLSQPGGPEFSAGQVQALAAEYRVTDGPNEQGEMFERPARPADRFPSPFPNAEAAKVANGGAYPPDFSVIAKARTYERGFPWFVTDALVQYQEHGVDYITALLSGYAEPPAGVTVEPGLHYNRFFPGNKIAMAYPLSAIVDEKNVPVDPAFFPDGTPVTQQQVARDVSAFLMWAAEPHLEERKRIGFQVMAFLIIFASLLFFVKKKVWSSLYKADGAAAH